MIRLGRERLRHVFSLVRLSRNPAATVYDALGGDFFLSPAPGWLNMGLWEGPGDEAEAETAVRRLVTTLARDLPQGADIVDVANGLGAQDLLLRDMLRPASLTAVNITESQLRHGRERLRAAGAVPLVADATRLPLAGDSADGMISVEAAFHFSSRHRFFAEARRVLRPGGVLVASDVSVERMPRTAPEAIAGFSNLRAWGIRRRALMSSDAIETALLAAGFSDVRVADVSAQVFSPAIGFFRRRLRSSRDAPFAYKQGSRLLLRQWDLLARRGLMRYLLIRAQVPGDSTSGRGRTATS